MSGASGWLVAGLAGLAAVGGGCKVLTIAAVPVKLVATTVVVAGETAGAVVATTGKVAAHAVRATGDLGSGGLDAVGRLGEAGMVTLVDGSSGAVTRVPWHAGLTLVESSEAAKVRLAGRVVQVVRAGRLVEGADAETLRAGDVVRLVG